MLIALCLFTIANSAAQDRTYAFLSYRDTVFATRKRNDWGEASGTTDFPHDPIDVQTLGLTYSRGPLMAMPEGWNSKERCFTVACADFEHVLGWSVNPQFPRQTTLRTDRDAQSVKQAKVLLHGRGVPFGDIRTLKVYSADLDGDGQQETLVELWMHAGDHNPGMVFAFSPTLKPQILAYCHDGWPKVLSVVELDHDNLMEVIVGGPTISGKTVSMWRFSRGKMLRLAEYVSSPQ